MTGISGSSPRAICPWARRLCCIARAKTGKRFAPSAGSGERDNSCRGGMKACYNSPMPALTDFDLSTLQEELQSCGIYPSHATRLLRAFYDSAGNVDLQSLPLGKALHRKLQTDLLPRQSNIIARHESADGTVKLLIEFSAGGAVETMLIP